jgi:hypothetical protein
MRISHVEQKDFLTGGMLEFHLFGFVSTRNVQIFSLPSLFYNEGWACGIIMSASVPLFNFEPIDGFHET